jgi:hypothetical protein
MCHLGDMKYLLRDVLSIFAWLALGMYALNASLIIGAHRRRKGQAAEGQKDRQIVGSML